MSKMTYCQKKIDGIENSNERSNPFDNAYP